MEAANEWKNIIIDKLVICGIFRKEHETNPRLAVDALLNWEIAVALDPAVSEDARMLLYTDPPTNSLNEEPLI